MKPFTYLLINLGCIAIPFIASFYPKHSFYREWKPLFLAHTGIAILFLVWDYFFTVWGFWGFNSDYLIGIYIAGLPLEEILFFFCIPYACVFVYFSIKYLIKKNPFSKIQKSLTLFLIAFLLGATVMAYGKWYTFFTALLTALYLLSLFVRKVDLAYHYLAYCLVIPFFFLSNGLLTGSSLEAPIVWYNDTQILGIRMLTIPVEDIFYGFLLVLMNIDLYIFLKKKLGFDSLGTKRK